MSFSSVFSSFCLYFYILLIRAQDFGQMSLHGHMNGSGSLFESYSSSAHGSETGGGDSSLWKHRNQVM